MLAKKKRMFFTILLTMLVLASGVGLAVQTHQQKSQVASVNSKPSTITNSETSLNSGDKSVSQPVKAAESKKSAVTTVTKANPVSKTTSAVVKPTAVPTKTTVKKVASTQTVVRKTTSSASSNQATSTPSRGGERTLTMLATAYDPGPECNDQWAGVSYLGTPLHYGIVAVDPDVIPLGSHLYIEGYGEGYAADTGGAIKGNRIDLCYDTYDEAMNFGMKYVKVTILN